MTSSLKHSDLTEKIIKTFYEVYNELGHGFLESVYETALMVALEANDIGAQNQVSTPVWFRDQQIGCFFADIIVEEKVILELKAVNRILDAHKAQLINYLRATDIEVGFVFNFGERPEFKRMVFENSRKKNLANDRS